MAPLPSDLPTAPACFSCNNGLSKDEEYFRAMVLSGGGFAHPVGRELWETKVRRSFAYKPEGLRALLAASMSPAIVQDAEGKTVGTVGVVAFDRNRIERVAKKIARGLYYRYFGTMLTADVPFLIAVEAVDVVGALSDNFQFWEALPGESFGDKVVVVRGGRARDKYEASIWYILFYNGTLITIVTGVEESG